MDRAALQSDLVRLADGDRDAFHPVFERLWPLLRAFCARHLPPADAADAAQDALLRVFFRAAEFDRERDALAWALGIAAWQVRTVRRRRERRREAPAEAAPVTADRAPTPEELLQARELDEVLDQLSAQDAQALRTWSRGERLPLPPATFRKRVERALARLRARLGVGHVDR